MPELSRLPPLSLYIHLPWCVQKCPYCDFNSHQLRDSLPQELYVDALMAELDSYLPLLTDRPIMSVFFGGGTPSLFSGKSIARILDSIRSRLKLAKDVEVTLEANPGTVDMEHFAAFRQAGVNRLSLGIQSLQNDKLQKLGRIHDAGTAIRAIELAKIEGFDNVNLDIMYGLPEQTLEEAISDIQQALSLKPTHFSWYQLTLEPNTVFYKQPPNLPHDEKLWEMQEEGQAIIKQQGFAQYEVSAYARNNLQCQHNLNYWEFGDYLGLGAGAHSKISSWHDRLTVSRFSQVKHPKEYLDANKRRYSPITINQEDLIFEFMLNGLRLTQGIQVAYFTQRTGLNLDVIADTLKKAQAFGLLMPIDDRIQASERGKQLLNDLVGMFLL